jgi:hypothetical protein
MAYRSKLFLSRLEELRAPLPKKRIEVGPEEARSTSR